MTGRYYTSGAWKVKKGRGDEFVREWERLADWATGSIEGASRPVLLQDRDDDSRFVSFGAWESTEAIAAFRSADEFKEIMAGLKELLEEFRPQTLELRAGGG